MQCEPDSKAQKRTLQLPFRLTTITFQKISKINAANSPTKGG